MKLNKITKAIVTTAAALALVVGGSTAAQAAENRIEVSGGYTVCFYDSDRTIKWCRAPGDIIFNKEYLIVPRGQCILFGQWSFVNYCADGRVDRLVPIGNGNYVAKRSR